MNLQFIRCRMRQYRLFDDADVLFMLQKEGKVTKQICKIATQTAADWIEEMRIRKSPGLMDIFMAEYGLSNAEGVALMCLAEALLRVPDAETIDALIDDKIASSDWSSHLGRSSSPLVNASTWALLLTGRVLDEKRPLAGVLHGAIKRVGEPVIRTAVKRAMRELGKQFVLGQNIEEAIKNGQSMRKKGYTYSYDMLGEAARSAGDALDYFNAYAEAISKIAKDCISSDVRKNPGISIKLSALFERYELSQRELVMKHLVPRVLILAQIAKNSNMGLNIDAEEAARLELSMDVIEAVLSDASLRDWDGFGIVVQAYGKRARFVIDWFNELAKSLERRVMLRLVKGAYWDSEIKLAQIDGIKGFPVFTSKPATDISYIENAAHLLSLTDVIYPQFATHNAHTVAMVKALAGDFDGYEFQRLHGMGNGLYDVVKPHHCRIYAPVGEHEDLLAYLVRRLLENGANTSFVNQVTNQDTLAVEIAADPYENLPKELSTRIKMPSELFTPRKNSRGWDIFDHVNLAQIEAARNMHKTRQYKVKPIIKGESRDNSKEEIINPATKGEVIGAVLLTSDGDVQTALKACKPWNASVQTRAAILRKAADIYENNFGEVYSVLIREAGKTPLDAIAELREAVDFLRYYADEASYQSANARGIFACISPWNFPLAIFTGQIAAALAAGNGVLAKPAEATSIISYLAVNWLLEAGVPAHSLQYLPGGRNIGEALTSASKINGICFTGSITTAQNIHRSMANHLEPSATLIAETGGLNAMIVDSTALPEQAVRDIIISAFQSAGQRCSACRVLFVQEEVADKILKMLFGAMDALRIGNPWDYATDIGPVISKKAKADIKIWINKQRAKGKIIKEIKAPKDGNFVMPTVIELSHISELEREIFGPVLHVIRFRSRELKKIMDDINATGFGLTFGMHSRIDDRVALACKRIQAGNIYINRNQIGAVVGSQPFGGLGLSGTGPKAGGPLYLHRFYKDADISRLSFDARMPGVTGESNHWSRHARSRILCLGPSEEDAKAQQKITQSQGGQAIIAINISLKKLITIEMIELAVYWGKEEDARKIRQALAARKGAIVTFTTSRGFAPYIWAEKHICIDTTASGGNVELLS